MARESDAGLGERVAYGSLSWVLLDIVRDHADLAFALFCTVALQGEIWLADTRSHRPAISLLALARRLRSRPGVSIRSRRPLTFGLLRVFHDQAPSSTTSRRWA